MPASGTRKRRRYHKHRRGVRLGDLKQKLEQGPFGTERVVVEPAGAERLSDVRAEFVAPYAQLAADEAACRKLLTLSVVAWTAALLPEGRQPEMCGAGHRSGAAGRNTGVESRLEGHSQTAQGAQAATLRRQPALHFGV